MLSMQDCICCSLGEMVEILIHGLSLDLTSWVTPLLYHVIKRAILITSHFSPPLIYSGRSVVLFYLRIYFQHFDCMVYMLSSGCAFLRSTICLNTCLLPLLWNKTYFSWHSEISVSS